MSTSAFIPDMLRLLGDVSIVAPSSGQALLHNGTTWQNRAITTDDVSGLTGMLASYAAKSGGNSLSGNQTLASGSSFVAVNGGDWRGVDITGTGVTGKDTSNTTTWSLNSATGVITAVGLGLTSLPAANLTGTVNAARLNGGTSASFYRADGTISSTFSSNLTVSGNAIVGGVYSSGGGTALSLNGGYSTIGTSVNIKPGSSMTASTGTQIACSVTPTWVQTGTAAATDFVINRTQTSMGSGPQLLFDAQVGGSSKFKIDNTNKATWTATGRTLEIYAGASDAGYITSNNTLYLYGTAGPVAMFGSNFGFGTSNQFGSGVGVVGIANATTAPTIAPIGGGVYWVEAGALKYMGSSGTITTLAAP